MQMQTMLQSDLGLTIGVHVDSLTFMIHPVRNASVPPESIVYYTDTYCQLALAVTLADKAEKDDNMNLRNTKANRPYCQNQQPHIKHTFLSL